MLNTPKHLALVVCCLALALARPVSGAIDDKGNGRPMTPEDLLRKQTIAETILSPDGKWAAIVVERPKKAGESYERGYLRGLERSDIWLASTDGRKHLNITRGELDHAGYWNPVWSPDSKRLAMASTRGGDNVRAYVYELNTQRLRRCNDQGLDLGLRIESAENRNAAMMWLDATRLLLGLLPSGVRPLAFDEMERTLRIASKAVADVKRGRGVTASVLTTDEGERAAAPQLRVALTVFDVSANSANVVTRIPLVETRLSQRWVSLSPDRSYAAVMATDLPNSNTQGRRPSSEDLSPLRIGVVNLRKSENPLWVTNVRPVTFGLGVVATPIRWAPSRATFAFIGMPVGGSRIAPAAFIVSATQTRPEALSATGNEARAGEQFLTAEDIQWTTSGELLIYGYAASGNTLISEASQKDVRGHARDNSKETARRDWWIVSSSNSSNLTREMGQAPRTLFKTRNSNSMFGSSGGRLWTIDTVSRNIKPLTPNDASPASIVWPRTADAYRPTDEIIVSRSKDAGADLFRLVLNPAVPTEIKLGTIPRGAVLTDYSPQLQLVAYETAITELCITGNNNSRTLLSLNRQLDEIAKAEYRNIQYQTSDAKQLSGSLLLPHGYTPGKRYPLIVYVYAGTLAPAGDWASPYSQRSYTFFNPMIFAGRGYAVLVPSMPLEPMGSPSDPMLDLDKGVKPAIERIVEMEIADPDRVGVLGFSYGGYSVYGLVTQTDRFKAGVAAVGMTDLTSYYGMLDQRYRFSEPPNPMWAPFLLETQQMRMGVSLWEDRERYLRNSPYFHADKVTTPLLMIHGDLDAVPLSQAEQFFVAMNRLGKRAKLVRYLGEGHSVDSPGNTLNMWEHILTWFDEFLQNPQANQSAKTKSSPR